MIVMPAKAGIQEVNKQSRPNGRLFIYVSCSDFVI
jgi:hypothetical protein